MRLLRLLSICTLALTEGLLTGCTSTPVAGSVSVESLKDRAIIVLSVSHDLEGGTNQNTVFYMDNEARGRLVVSTYLTEPGAPFVSDFQDRFGQLKFFEVSPGKHQFDYWQVATGSIRLFPKTAPKPLEFEVRSGEVIYLGNLHAKLQLDRPLLFGMKAPSQATPMVVDRSTDDLRVAGEKMPSLQGRITVRLLPLGPWTHGDGVFEKIDAPPPMAPLKK